MKRFERIDIHIHVKVSNSVSFNGAIHGGVAVANYQKHALIGLGTNV